MFTILWLLFAALFLALAIFHFNLSRRSMPRLQVATRPMSAPDAPVRVEIEFGGIPLDAPLSRFVDDFNVFVDEQNRSARGANRAAAFGYLLACLTAVASLWSAVASS